jgi:hypothetical protein
MATRRQTKQRGFSSVDPGRRRQQSGRQSNQYSSGRYGNQYEEEYDEDEYDEDEDEDQDIRSSYEEEEEGYEDEYDDDYDEEEDEDEDMNVYGSEEEDDDDYYDEGEDMLRRVMRMRSMIRARDAIAVHAGDVDLVATGEEAMVVPIHPGEALQRWTQKKEGE